MPLALALQLVRVRPSIAEMPLALSYGRDTSVRIAESASLISCNLSVLSGLEEDSLAYGVVSGHLAAITHVSADGGTAESETVGFSGSEEDSSSRTLTGVEWCRLKSSRVILVLTSYRGFTISSWNGSELVYENIFDSRKGSYDQRFAKGVTSIDNVVCVGTSEGNIIVLYVPPVGSEVVFSRQLQGHSAAITALYNCGHNQVASSDESGMIIVWANPVISAESRLVINNPGGVPCLCLCQWRSLILVGGFSNGLIRLYSIETGHKTVEIAAHGRSVSALDIAQDSGLLLSVSEDCTACVWRLPTEANPKVSQLFCVHTADSLLCGGGFCDSRGDRFAVTAYDSGTILTFRKQQQTT